MIVPRLPVVAQKPERLEERTRLGYAADEATPFDTEFRLMRSQVVLVGEPAFAEQRVPSFRNGYAPSRDHYERVDIADRRS